VFGQSRPAQLIKWSRRRPASLDHGSLALRACPVQRDAGDSAEDALFGSLEATRRSFNKDFLLALAADFKKHGAAAIEKVREQQPAAYMKICALLVPREMKLEHSGGVKDLTDEELEQAIAAIKTMLAAQAGEAAKVIEGEAEVVPSLPAPARPTKAS
jgi:hypothetical protein